MINKLLTTNDRIAISQRQLLYFIDVPTFFIHGIAVALVDTTTDNRDTGRFIAQLHAQQITHLLHVIAVDDPTPQTGGFIYLTQALVNAGCAHPIDEQTATMSASRTLALGSSERHAVILAIDYDRCPLYHGQ